MFSTAWHTSPLTLGPCVFWTTEDLLQPGNYKWLKNHPGRAVTQFHIIDLLKAAYGKAATAGAASSGFQKTRIVPFNPDIFPDHLYAPAEVTDQPEHSRHEAEEFDQPELSSQLYCVYCGHN